MDVFSLISTCDFTREFEVYDLGNLVYEGELILCPFDILKRKVAIWDVTTDHRLVIELV